MKLATVLALTSLASPLAARAASYEIDPAHSTAGFATKHMVVSTVRGSFSNVKGTVTLDEKDASKSTVEATIDATTVNTGVEKRDAHLKSPDFFDVAKFPALAFKSTAVEKTGEGKFKVTGNLTLHGVTKPVVLEVESAATEAKDPWGNIKRGATATTTLNRKDFGLTYNQALETGGVMVGDEVKVTLDLELNRKDAAPAKKI